MDEIEIEWIPEDTGAPYTEIDMLEPEKADMPMHLIDKLCKRKFGHTNWARLDQSCPADLIANPWEIDYNEGIIYFKNRTLV